MPMAFSMVFSTMKENKMIKLMDRKCGSMYLFWDNKGYIPPRKNNIKPINPVPAQMDTN